MGGRLSTRPLSCAVLAALVLAGCGSASGAGYAKHSAASILSDTAQAIGAAGSFVLAGTIDQHGTHVSTTVDFHRPADLAASIVEGPELIRVVTLTTGSYIYGNTVFWKSHAGGLSASLVARYANRWFKAPASLAGSLTSSFKDLTPKVLSECLSTTFPQPTVQGTRMLAGQSVVVLHSDGGTPGSGAGDLYVSTQAPHYPLRFQPTGATAPGGTGVCAKSAIGASAKGVVDFSGWDATSVSAPAHAAPLP